jgi:hypothetical protein
MRHLLVLFIRFIASLARLLGPGGVRSPVAELLQGLLAANVSTRTALLASTTIYVCESLQIKGETGVNSRRFAQWHMILNSAFIKGACVIRISGFKM